MTRESPLKPANPRILTINGGSSSIKFARLTLRRQSSGEELAFGEISTGAQNDLLLATDIVKSMVTEYGMNDRPGLVTYAHARQPLFPPGRFAPSKISIQTIDSSAGNQGVVIES